MICILRASLCLLCVSREDPWSTQSVNDVPEALYALQKHLEQEIEPIKDLSGWNMAAITAGRGWRKAT